jgi:hypothetical protein
MNRNLLALMEAWGTRRARGLKLALALAITLLAAPAAVAETVTLTATDSKSIGVTGINVDDNILRAYYDSQVLIRAVDGFVKFDLSSIPDGVTITAATLRTYVTSVVGAPAVSIYRAASNTWSRGADNSYPGLGDLLSAAPQTSFSLGAMDWPLAVGPLNSSTLLSDNVLSLVTHNTVEADSYLYQDGSDPSGHPPTLTLTYSTGDPNPPVTTATFTANGSPYTPGAWTRYDVQVGLTAADNGGSGTKEITYSATGAQSIPSTTVSGAAAQLPLITSEGVTTLAYHAADNAGNAETAQSATIKIDKTPPVVTFSGNTASYMPNETVNITCTATDALSGIMAEICPTIIGPASSFHPGLNTYSAVAVDQAGNVGTATVQFFVGVTINGLIALTREWVTNEAAERALCFWLTNAGPYLVRNRPAARAFIAAYIRDVSHRTDTGLTAEQKDLLIRLAGDL